MAEYDPNRRIAAVPRLGTVTKNEAAEGTDLRRTNAFEKVLETNADERKRLQGAKKRSFADALGANSDDQR